VKLRASIFESENKVGLERRPLDSYGSCEKVRDSAGMSDEEAWRSPHGKRADASENKSIILCLKSGYRPSSLTGQFFSALLANPTGASPLPLQATYENSI